MKRVSFRNWKSSIENDTLKVRFKQWAQPKFTVIDVILKDKSPPNISKNFVSSEKKILSSPNLHR